MTAATPHDLVPTVLDDTIADISLRQLNSGRFLRLAFDTPQARPPVLSEMMPDINRLIASIARQSEDKTCPQLSFEDLQAECAVKLAKVLNNAKYLSIPTRSEAFKYLKTVFNNHVRGQVAKYRFTLKRGGRRATDDVPLDAYTKQTDLRLDDEEAGLQIADQAASWLSAESLIEDLKPYLTPLELLVVTELNTPSHRTMVLAELSAYDRWKPGSPRPRIKLSYAHMAEGIGIGEELFDTALTSIQEKIKHNRMTADTDKEIKWNRAVTILEEAFGIHMPASLDKTVARRMFTIAALDQHDKVEASAELQAALNEVGARVPDNRGGHLACFGTLYQPSNRACGACGLQRPCADEAATVGLDKIVLSDRLLGARALRVPAVIPNGQVYMTPDEEQIVHYMSGFLAVSQDGPETQFKMTDSNKVVLVVEQIPNFRLKFIRPSAEVRAKLVKEGSSYYMQDGTAPDTAVGLISAHCTDQVTA